MKKIFLASFIFTAPLLFAQDSLFTNSDTLAEEKKPVKIFASERAINANTTEIVGKGKMEFLVTHNFDDLAGTRGGLKNFFGLDNSTDIRIGFHLGLTDRLNLQVARSKGGNPMAKFAVFPFYELGLKYQLMRQYENDPSHPFAVTLYANNVITSRNSSYTAPRINGVSTDTALNQPHTFQNFGDRMSQTLQLNIAKKIRKVSVQLSFTMVHQGYVPLHDEETIFALGGILRLPLMRNLNLVMDYFHPFRSKESRDYFKQVDDSFNPPGDIDKNSTAFRFYDPLGVGFEIITPGHIFHIKFTNATQILENRFIPYTVTSWGKGQFRWGFTISRSFVLWREKQTPN
ncbi:MAG TPA: DUF5777 family beta-barrel protein [Chitinophagaceae bacterium]|nr:DUF5777 family beta-barrel protein [Chitinophagaceae bacterium]